MFYTHYRMDYYPRFLAELHLIDLARDADPATAQRLRDVTAAMRSYAEADGRMRRAQVRHLKKRIRRAASQRAPRGRVAKVWAALRRRA